MMNDTAKYQVGVAILAFAEQSQGEDTAQTVQRLYQTVREIDRITSASGETAHDKHTSLQDEIAKWSMSTFGGRDDHQRWKKLKEEVEELGQVNITDPDGIESECADIMHILFQFAYWYQFDLLEATRKKFEVNKTRTWTEKPDGTFKHEGARR